MKVAASLVLALVLAATACGGESPASGEGSPTSGGDRSATAAPSTATADILAFSAPSLGGGTIDGTDYAGDDLAIWFWAPW